MPSATNFQPKPCFWFRLQSISKPKMALTLGLKPKLFFRWQLFLGSLFEMVNYVKLSIGVTSIIFDDYDCNIIDCDC